ncbi:MBL fold metallo-hydrolase [Chloroflexota bacterium]
MSVISEILGRIQSTSEIVPYVYQLAMRGTNTILIVEDKLTLIDTGHRGTTPQIIEFIRYLGRSPEEISLIILTHNHIDHVGGLAKLRQLTPAKVAIHKSDIGSRKSLPSAESEDVDICLEGSEVLEPLGGLEIIHTPGHTPGSISLYSPRNKLLIVGDALRKRRKTVLPPAKMISSDMTQARESIKKMAGLDFNVLCFGHGLPLVDNARARIQELIERSKD